MNSLGRIAILGGGTWATAIAKIILVNQTEINWYMRRPEQIEDFKKVGHNPSYLTNVAFDLSKINFYSDLNEIVNNSDTIIFAIPSPFLKEHLLGLTASLGNKLIVSAIKGIIPSENLLISKYISKSYNVSACSIAIVGGPCHAEEVALERLSYLTIACEDLAMAEVLSQTFTTRFIKTTTSTDVAGIEIAAVLKNVYAIASGICHGLKYGDNFQAVLISNAVLEMQHCVHAVRPIDREICESAYLGDLLVTAYSSFSRNRTFGSMIGKGYSVKAAQVEMEMIAEGYYGTKCIMEMCAHCSAEIPIVNAVYRILYEQASARSEMKRVTEILK